MPLIIFRVHLTYCQHRFERKHTLNLFRLGRCDSDIFWLRHRSAGFLGKIPLPIRILTVADTKKYVIYHKPIWSDNRFCNINGVVRNFAKFFFYILYINRYALVPFSSCRTQILLRNPRKTRTLLRHSFRSHNYWPRDMRFRRP